MSPCAFFSPSNVISITVTCTDLPTLCSHVRGERGGWGGSQTREEREKGGGGKDILRGEILMGGLRPERGRVQEGGKGRERDFFSGMRYWCSATCPWLHAGDMRERRHQLPIYSERDA